MKRLWFSWLVGAVATGMFSIPTGVQALPMDYWAGMQNVRQSSHAGAHWTAYGYYVLPAGAQRFAHGGYHYYRAGETYYYPYIYSGRTIYVTMQTDHGVPLPPPPVSGMEILLR